MHPMESTIVLLLHLPQHLPRSCCLFCYHMSMFASKLVSVLFPHFYIIPSKNTAQYPSVSLNHLFLVSNTTRKELESVLLILLDSKNRYHHIGVRIDVHFPLGNSNLGGIHRYIELWSTLKMNHSVQRNKVFPKTN